jgi:hypothetical protein
VSSLLTDSNPLFSSLLSLETFNTKTFVVVGGDKAATATEE